MAVATMPPSQPPVRTGPIAINTQVSSPVSPVDKRASTAVGQDGVLEMDKVLNSGWLQKRTRKTKGWKRRWFVLRADRLSCYKDQNEYKIHRQIYLSDVTACATLKDKKPNVFGVFTTGKNFHFQGANTKEAQEWVEQIRKAAGIEDGENEMMVGSPVNPNEAPSTWSGGEGGKIESVEARLGSSSSERGTSPKIGMAARMSTQTLDYSGPDVGSVSSFSDGARISSLSLSHADPGAVSGNEGPPVGPSGEPEKPARNLSGLSTGENQMDYPRVIWHGNLYCLKSRRGIKHWKKYWVVIRNVNVAFYKNDQEYRAIKIIPIEAVVDAAEIDPLSKSKKHCLQIITEQKSYRFSATDEEVLANCLGAIKSSVSKSRAQRGIMSPKPGPVQTAQQVPAGIPPLDAK